MENIMSHVNSVYSHPPYFITIICVNLASTSRSSKWSVTFRYLDCNFSKVIHVYLARCSCHLDVPAATYSRARGTEPSLCTFLYPPVTSSLLGPDAGLCYMTASICIYWCLCPLVVHYQYYFTSVNTSMWVINMFIGRFPWLVSCIYAHLQDVIILIKKWI